MACCARDVWFPLRFGLFAKDALPLEILLFIVLRLRGVRVVVTFRHGVHLP